MENRICNGSFDDIMSLMTGANLYSDSIFNNNFMERLKLVKISNELLLHLENDYANIVQLSSRNSF